MASELITRRNALKYAGVIALAASGLHVHVGYAAALPARGYGTDPNLLNRLVTWPRTLSSSQLGILERLCDIVLPAEPPHPSAAAIGVQEFLDEWVSAPYPQMQADRVVILGGVAALEAMAQDRSGIAFVEADAAQQIAVFDQACGKAATAAFARRLIELICDGYYTTREGHAAIGYVGNKPLTSFPEPPPEVLSHLDQALRQLRQPPTLT
jgi:hypothetical protein